MRKKVITIATQITVSLLCVFYALRGVELAKLSNVLSEYAPLPMLAATAFVVVNMLVMSARIGSLCGPRIGFRGAQRATIVGQGLNNVMPAKGGDVAKIIYINRISGIPASEAAGAVIVERFFDANCLFLLSVIMLRGYVSRPALAGAGAVFFICWALFILSRLRPAQFERAWDFIPALGKIKFLDNLKKYLLYKMTARQLAICALTTAGSWSAYCAFSVISFLRVGNFGISLADASVAFIVSAAGQLVPSSPGSLGVLEASIVWGLGLFGVEKEPALGIAFFIRAAQFLPTLGAAVIFADDAVIKLRKGR